MSAMGSDIVLSAGVRQNLLALQNTARLMGITQNRLATGKAVNTALDNPVNFFTAAGLQSRAGDMNALLDAMGNGVKTLEAADNGLTSITKPIESMKSTLQQVRQDKSFKTQSYAVDTATIGTTVLKQMHLSGGSLTGTVDIDLNSAGTGGTQGSLGTTGAYAPPAAAQKALYTAQNAFASSAVTASMTITFTASSGSISSVDVTLAGTEGTLQEAVDKINAAILLDPDSNGVIKAQANGTKLEITSVNNADGAISVADKNVVGSETAIFGTEVTQAGSDGAYVINVNGTSVTLSASDSPSLSTAINTANLQLASTSFQAYDAGGGKLGFREKTAQGVQVTLAGYDATALFGATLTSTNAVAGAGGAVKTVDELVAAINANTALQSRVTATNDNGQLRLTNMSTGTLTTTGVGSVSGKIDGTTGTGTINGNEVRQNLVKQFNDLRDQLDKTADDSSFNGVNLLRGDQLKITFNETGTSTLLIQAKDQNGNVRPISAANLNISFLVNADFNFDTNIDSLLDGLTQSLNIIRSQSSTFGSNLSVVQNRTEFTKSMINTLQTGADGLVLADTNEEGANMLALQTRQQLSTTALSLANQASQAVLRLFG